MAFAAAVICRTSSSSRRKVRIVVPSNDPVSFWTSINFAPLHQAKTASILHVKSGSKGVSEMPKIANNKVSGKAAQRVWSLWWSSALVGSSALFLSASSKAKALRLQQIGCGWLEKNNHCSRTCSNIALCKHLHPRVEFVHKLVLVQVDSAGNYNACNSPCYLLKFVKRVGQKALQATCGIIFIFIAFVKSHTR